MHLVDVVVPTRNRLEMTLECVGSVRAQTDDRWHLYLVDDASDDGSYEQICRELGSDERITVLRHEVAGRAAKARQTGFEAGRAPWVATLDSDDLWLPEKLSKQLALADRGHDVIIGWHSWVRADGSVRTTVRPSGTGRVSPLLTNNVDVALMRRDLVARVGGFWGPNVLDLRADENIEFFIRLLSEADLAVVPEVVALCRDHSGIRTSDAMEPTDLAKIIATHRQLVESSPDYGAMLCRIGARYLAARNRRVGWSYTWRGLRAAPSPSRYELVRTYLPSAVKNSLVRT